MMGISTATIVFLGNGRCYHTIDWFRSAQRIEQKSAPILITDLIESESFEKLIEDDDLVRKLFVLDKLLFPRQSRVGDIWRNILKLVFLPFQVFRLRKLLRTVENPVIHAHSMYYIALARFSNCKYVATPQGSEVLVRPFRSHAYKMFASIALKAASRITVDSESMHDTLKREFGVEALVVQNGINVHGIREVMEEVSVRDKLSSIRAISPNYQIHLLLDARKRVSSNPPIHFCYPFIEERYKAYVQTQMTEGDCDLGRLQRRDLYKLLAETKIAFSIPKSDSSPRSVYEAIFCGCFVAVTETGWLSRLPACMASRVIVVNLESDSWFAEALKYATDNIDCGFLPSSKAMEMFDQQRLMSRFYEEIYPEVFVRQL